MWKNFKVFIEFCYFVTVLLLFYVLGFLFCFVLFGPEACGILALQHPALGCPRKTSLVLLEIEISMNQKLRDEGFPWFSLSAIVEKSCHSDLSFFISHLATWEKISSPFSFRPSNCVSFVYIFGYTVVLCFLMYFPISGYQLGVECLWSLTNVHLAS